MSHQQKYTPKGTRANSHLLPRLATPVLSDILTQIQSRTMVNNNGISSRKIATTKIDKLMSAAISRSSMVLGDSNKTTMKASHRAFRSNKATGIMSSSSLLLKTIRKSSQFVRVNKGLLATSILMTGSFHAYKSHIREDLSLNDTVSQQTVPQSLTIRERIQ